MSNSRDNRRMEITAASREEEPQPQPPEQPLDIFASHVLLRMSLRTNRRSRLWSLPRPLLEQLAAHLIDPAVDRDVLYPRLIKEWAEPIRKADRHAR